MNIYIYICMSVRIACVISKLGNSAAHVAFANVNQHRIRFKQRSTMSDETPVWLPRLRVALPTCQTIGRRSVLSIVLV